MIYNKIKLNIFLAFLLVAFSGHSNVEINSWNELIKRGNTFYSKTDNKPFTGILKNFHETGSLSLIDHFKDGKQHGDFKTFHENGEISMKGQFFEGIKTGDWFEFHDDGSIYWKLSYIDGKIKDGLFQMFHKNGQIRSEVTYKNDKPISNWTYYDENGEVERIDIYRNGKFFYEKHLK